MTTNRGYTAQDDFETLVARIGKRGLNLVKELDGLEIDELSRMTNLRRLLGGGLEVRPGETSLSTGGTHHHSLGRLNIPASSSFLRFYGIDTAVYTGNSGAATSRDTGYSGDPITLLPHRPKLTGTPWMYVADRSKMRKISSAGTTVRTIGIAAPSAAPTTAVFGEYITTIARFDNANDEYGVADGTAAGSWTLAKGLDEAGTTPTNFPVASNVGNSVLFTTDSAGVGAGLSYYQLASIAKARDLTKLQLGVYDATDNDLMNFQIRIDRPDRLEEFRVYFVVSAFTASIIPGASSSQNTDAYWKSFRANDISNYLDLTLSSATVAPFSVDEMGDSIRDQRLREEFKVEREGDTRDISTAYQAGTDTARKEVHELLAGRNALSVTGVIGNPLRRGDFARIGTDTTKTWANVTGIVLVFRANTNAAIGITCDDWRITGGAGPDTSEQGTLQYDYRFTDYDPDTGTESNPSPVQTESLWLDALRQPLSVDPASNGISTYRQRVYRRGGTLTDNWYFVGVNSSDGGVYTDSAADADIAASATLQIDNYQPVPTVNSSGVTVLAQAVPCLWGPVEDLIFATGDPNRPGHVYWSKPGEPDHWPAENNLEVCSPSEELMNGGVYAGAAFVFSRERGYLLHSNVVSGAGVVASPTACGEGLISRWGLATGRGGIYFVSRDGVRVTQGGESQLISIPISPLFTGDTKNGFAPIDFTAPTAIKLSLHDDDLWFVYKDTNGTRQVMVYNLIDQAWRYYSFGKNVSCAFSEPNNAGGLQLLLGGTTTGKTYTHDGFTDDSTAIAVSCRTGAWDWGRPREDKMLGDVVIDANLAGTPTLTLQTYLNNEQTANTAQGVTGVSGRNRYMFDPFGTLPAAARNASFNLSMTSPTGARPVFNFLGCAARLDPDTTIKRATNWEELPGGEGYLTGVRIICDSANTEMDVEVEYTVANGSVTSAATINPQANGKRILHFTWNAVYAQQVRLRPTGTCEAWKVYKVDWITQSEPPRIAGWDTNWSSHGILADKKIKGFIIHCDTFGQAKSWALDIDGSNAVQSSTVTQSGPGVQMFTFAESTGRFLRFRATDTNPGKLYKWQPIFDIEPLKLTRWETQEVDHGYQGWQMPIEGYFTLRSTASVTLDLTIYDQLGATVNTRSYSISSTAGVKAPRYVQFYADKGCLFKYVLTSSAAFWLYREESFVDIQPFGGGKLLRTKPFGNDDLDASRSMGTADTAASHPGGMLDNK